jgi:hypothetical protein
MWIWYNHYGVYAIFCQYDLEVCISEVLERIAEVTAAVLSTAHYTILRINHRLQILCACFSIISRDNLIWHKNEKNIFRAYQLC